MAEALHIQILEYLRQHNAVDHMVDIKPAFEAELDSTQKRKAFKAELDLLLDQNLIEAFGRFEFLNWELLNGLYPLDNKKIEARLYGEWRAYLNVEPDMVPTEPAAAVEPSAPAEALIEPTPVTETIATQTVSIKDAPGNASANAEPVPEPKPVQPVHIEGVINKRAAFDENAPIVTARTANAFNKQENNGAQPVAKTPAPRLKSVADMPPGAVNLKSFKKPAIPVREAKNLSPYFATDNTPFSDLEVIKLNPVEDNSKKNTTIVLLKWLAFIIAIIVLLVVYGLYKKHTT